MDIWFVVSDQVFSTVYMYDPMGNTWTQKANFPGGGRQAAIGFSLNGKGYLLGGFTGGSSAAYDMWEYDPGADSWTLKGNVPGSTARNGPIGLVINNQAYVGMGCGGSGGSPYSDFYRYDPVANTYTQLASIPGARDDCAHFAIGNFGYFGLGQAGTTVLRDFYKYDPASNTWTALNNFGGAARGWGYSETLGSAPYVGAGANLYGNTFFNDNWTWDVCNMIVDLGRDTTICTGSTLTLSNGTANATFLWSTGSTSSSINVTSPGSYWVHVTSGNCLGADTINVAFANPSAPFDLGNDTIYCGPFTRTLSTGDPNTVWSTGLTSSSISVSSPGLYWAEVSGSCQGQRDSIEFYQTPLPGINLGNDTNLCVGSALTLDATTNNATYFWQDATMSPTLNVSAQGTYWVDVTVNGCTKRDSIAVGYINPGTFDIGNDTVYCGNFSRVLTGGIANTVWNTGVTATSITVDSPGIYIGTVSACGVTLTDSVTLTENALPVVDIGNDTSLCTGSTLVLDASTANATYTWMDNSSNPTLIVSASGDYWVDVIVDGCATRDSIFVNYLSIPIGYEVDTTICEDSIMIFDVYQPYAHYQWSSGDTTSSIATGTAGEYVVTVTNACGSIVATENLSTYQCFCKIAIPTAFSPNGDGKNEKYGVLTICPLQDFEFSIYNRWGQKIFVTNSLNDKWDGTYKGVPQPIEVYIYYFKYTDPFTNKTHHQSGNVTLLR
jgi:gliding motility-associated-like protein